MPGESEENVTGLLIAWSNGDQEALESLIPAIYDELRRMAARYLRRERSGHTLETSALAHEAYLRLVDQNRVIWRNRAHFFAIAAQMMRRILVDHARSQRYAKRGGGARKLSLDEAPEIAREPLPEMLAIDEALKGLAEVDERKSRLVELRYFGGLTNEEIGEVLDISTATVTREWRTAKAWLYRYLAEPVAEDRE
jgi:RNA polymerase sigma-70 factor (ECF subfamily)